MQEQGKLPSQTQPNPRGVHGLRFSTEPAPRMDEVKAIITLRSGKQVDQPVPIPVEETKEEKEVEPEHMIIKEDSMKKIMPSPFPQALKGKKKASNHTEILEVLRQVKVKIPLLDMIKQVPTYVKFLKDLCTMKRGLDVDKKAFLTEQVNAIIQSKTPVKYKDPGSPTISVNIGGNCVDKALVELGGQCQPATILSVQATGFRGIKAYNHHLIFGR